MTSYTGMGWINDQNSLGPNFVSSYIVSKFVSDEKLVIINSITSNYHNMYCNPRDCVVATICTSFQ